MHLCAPDVDEDIRLQAAAILGEVTAIHFLICAYAFEIGAIDPLSVSFSSTQESTPASADADPEPVRSAQVRALELLNGYLNDPEVAIVKMAYHYELLFILLSSINEPL